ncbi:MAG: Mu transposase C-terminal domain-containing protein, partial [Acidobacteriota bacterium]
PEGRGKQERINRYIRERFLAEAEHQGINNLDELNDQFMAWYTQVANRRIHSETGQSPEARFEAAGPPRAARPELLADAFRWSAVRKVTRTATVSLEGNAFAVDPALVGRRVELRFDPEDMTDIQVWFEGQQVGAATTFVIGTHTSKRLPPPPQQTPPVTGVHYLGMVAKAHEAETVGSISFADAAQLAVEKAVEEAN